jgi:hypothetical protein
MPRTGRRTAALVMAGGLIAAAAVAGGVLAAAAATANTGRASVSISIAATSPHYPGAVHGKVYGYALTVYKLRSGSLDTAIISGRITDPAPSDLVRLLAEPFGARTFRPTGAIRRLSGKAAAYRFYVVPSAATRYEVQVGTVTSTRVTVYVTESGAVFSQAKSCSSTGCTYTNKMREQVPVNAYSTESGKRWYLYQAVGYPKLPKFFTLSASARATRLRRVSAGEFEIIFTWHVKVSAKHETRWLTTFCTKDTESRDGLGLPGQHSCGVKTIPVSAIYLG